MPQSPHRGHQVFQRLRSPRSKRSLFSSESTPLLPLTHSPQTTPDLRTLNEDRTLNMSSAAVSNTLAPPSPHGKGQKRSSILGASRKVVSSAVRKPLKAVGRAVSRSGKTPRTALNAAGLEDGLEDNEEGFEVTEDGYGSIVPAGHEDLEASTEITPLVDNTDGICRSTGSLGFVDSPVAQTMPTRAVVDPDWPVRSVERVMRQLVFVFVAYVIGSKWPGWAGWASRAAEYAVTAWGTCIVILILAHMQKTHPSMVHTIVREEPIPMLQQQDVPANRSIPSEHKPKPLLTSSPRSPVEIPGPDSQIDRSISADDSLAATSTVEDAKVSHPDIAKLFVVDAITGERIYPNSSEPTHISTEWFEMDMIVLLRTPDVDDPKAEKGLPENDRWVDYLRGRQRRFEFQYQLKLKKLPVGQSVYFACELEEPVKLGLIQRAFVGAAMAFMKSTNPTFHYSITGSKDRTPDGKYEKPHMSFTVEGSLDRLVVSKPGETPPELGTAIEEDPESIKRRKKGVAVDWNLEDTYTMALWSAYVDFLDWRVINLPGIRPFGLNSVLGSQPIYFTMYLIKEDRDNDKHLQKDITNVINLEFSNDVHGARGSAVKKWIKKSQLGKKKPPKARPVAKVESEGSTHEEKATGEGGNDIQGQELQITQSMDELNVEDLDDGDDVETAAELGEGIYMRTGDPVCLRELLPDNEDEITRSCCVANGGGFAVLQEQDVAIVVEKARAHRKNRLIKSGDTVMFKMMQKKQEEVETRYLTIHRGWWLKWVSSVPSKNGYFTIYSHDTDFDAKSSDSSYLTIGASFTLRHKRWSSYYVGVAGEPSPTYGGRMLGLYNPKSKEAGQSATATDEQYHSDEGEGEDSHLDFKANKPTWMKPTVFTVVEPPSIMMPSLPLSPKHDVRTPSLDDNPLETPSFMPANKVVFSSEHAHVDVPAWIEMMNRTDRVRQLAYVVRVSHGTAAQELHSEETDPNTGVLESEQKTPDVFVRLRSGREVARIMRVGQSVRMGTERDFGSGKRAVRRSTALGSSSNHAGSKMAVRHSFSEGQFINMHGSASSDRNQGLLTLSPQVDKPVISASDYSSDQLGKDDESDDESTESPLENIPSESDEDADAEDGEYESPSDESETETEHEHDGERRRKRGVVGTGKALVGKVAKTAKNAAVGTGKLTAKTVVGTGKLTAKTVVGTGKLTAKTVVGAGKLTGKAAVGAGKLTGKAAKGTAMGAVRGGKKVAKGTVNVGKSAGKAVIAPISRKSKKPPKAEPRAKHKEDQLEVSRTLRKLGKIEKKSSGPPSFLAGELCAPEQSCRTASSVLSRMSTVPFMSTHWRKFNDVLTEQVAGETEQDRWFLEGTSVQLGVTPLANDKSSGKLIYDSLVGRCLWESHWREEWCGMYESCLSFYPPLSKAPCLEIAYIDITHVRPLEAGASSPLPGYPLLVLETAWICHYIAFRDEASRDTFGEKVEEAIEIHIKRVEQKGSLQEEDLRKARFWQGFQSLSESSLSTGIGKWAKISSKEKLKERAILNGRRMAFDTEGTAAGDANGFAFVEEMLTKSLSFSLETLENDPESFVNFLDLTSQLRSIPLEDLDLSSGHAFCLFTNIYHCLLQQAMLLSVNGPMDKKSAIHFMRTSCYEIGGEVFSLAELSCCVIRGKMSRPINPKSPYIEAPKKSSAYRHYGLEYRDRRVNFVLCSGDFACPQTVPVLRAHTLDKQLDEATAEFLKQELMIDPKKGIVILPKVCEVYKNDFGGDSLSVLKFCMSRLDDTTARTIKHMVSDPSNLQIKYQHGADQFHTVLRLRESPNNIPIALPPLSSR